MKSNFYILFIITSICVISCGVSKEIKRNFTVCYTENSKKDTSLFGVYHLVGDLSNVKMSLFSRGMEMDSYIVFYEDGSSALSYNFSNMIRDRDFIKTYLKYPYWGLYKIDNEKDIIKTQYIKKAHSLNDSWDAYEISFKIINSKKLKMISAKRLWGEQSIDITSLLYANFIEQIHPPPYDNHWLKKEKWFWCNKSDWEEYMRKIK